MIFSIFMFATTNIIAKRVNAYNHFFETYTQVITYSPEFFKENSLYLDKE